jgi:hypothetical protein
MFLNDRRYANEDHLGQVAQSNSGGAILFSARQSRMGFKLDVDGSNITGSKLTGQFEFDFNAGHIPSQFTTPACTSTAVPAAGGTPTITCGAVSSGAPSTAWYNGVMRLRLASLTSTWKIPTGSVALLLGQDYGLVNPLFAETISWVANPLFSQAGNIWRRAPQFRLTYAGTFDVVGVSVAVAALSPADNAPALASDFPASAGGSQTSPVDFGAGNQSKMPELEGRIGITVKPTKDISAAIGGGASFGKRRYGAVPQNAAQEALWAKRIDVSSSLYGVDLDVNVPFVQVKGEFYTSKGMDDSYNGIITRPIGILVTVPADATTTPVTQGVMSGATIRTTGFWGQAIIKPVPEVFITAGYGSESANEDDLKAAPVVATAGLRQKNTQLAFGVIGNLGKFWRLGAEWGRTTTTYIKQNTTALPYQLDYPRTGNQVVISSMLRF